MNQSLKKLKWFFIGLVIMMLTANFASSQTKLRSGAAVKSFIGGESHDSFVIRARKGQMMTVLITRRVKKDGNFNLTVSKGATFAVGEPVKFGKETDSRTQLRWTGRIPSSGNYYFYTTAYPDAKYVLKVTVK